MAIMIMLVDTVISTNNLRKCHVAGYIVRVVHTVVPVQVILYSLKLFALPTHSPTEGREVN